MTQILVTIGPISQSNNAIKSLASKTNLFRLNGSHNTLEWHKEIISKIRKISPSCFILMDIPGIKPRTDNFNNIFISKGEMISFGKDTHCKEKIISITKPLPNFDKKIKEFSINDGQHTFELIKSSSNVIVGKSKSSFELLPKKGINIPRSLYNEKKQKELYINFIDKIKDLDIDGLGLSFVQTGKLVKEIKSKFPNLILISKIENSAGLEHKNDIIINSDGIMIDRGDLAAEIGNHLLFYAVENISRVTKKFGKPLIMATENLNSMIDRTQPSKSEIISIGHSLNMGVDCIMLSEETATSKNFLETTRWICKHSKKFSETFHNVYKVQNFFENIKFPELWSAVEQFPELPIVLLSKSGHSLFNAMSLGQTRKITLFTDNKKVVSLTKLYKNKINVVKITNINENTSSQVRNLISKHKSLVFGKKSKLIAIYVSHYVRKVRANNFSLFDKKDFD